MDSSHHGSSHAGVNHPFFRQITQDRLLKEMLQSARTPSKAPPQWKVLIMDEVTVKIMSCACNMADITDEGISLVEDLNKRRQPLPALEAVYFIHPSHNSVQKFIQDMSGRSPRYKKAYVFFSSTLDPNLLKLIKDDRYVLSRVGFVREMNLEYLAVDTHGFTTDNNSALEELIFGCSGDPNSCIETIATRLFTVFASLKEFPCVRYRVAWSAMDASTATTVGELVPTKVAAVLWDKLMRHKANVPLRFPQSETCELLIVDRSIDPIAAVVHDWSYDAMCHDLLDMEGNKYSYQVVTGSGKEVKEVLLEDHDPIWVELRDLFIGEVMERLPDKMAAFTNANKVAQLQLKGGRGGRELSMRDMQKVGRAFPQYQDQIDKLSRHVHICSELNSIILKDELKDIGKLEQEFVYSCATSKELIAMFNTKPKMSADCKLRLLMIYAATHPDELDARNRLTLQLAAKLTDEEMSVVDNLKYLGVDQAARKQASTSGVGKFALKFGFQKKAKQPARKAKEMDGGRYHELSRFSPLLEDVVKEIDKGTLSRKKYPYVNDQSSCKPVQSRCTIGKVGCSSNDRASSDDGCSMSDSVSKHGVNRNRKRIIVFIIGGMTRSELKVAHELTQKLRREVVVGSTNLWDPHQFIQTMKNLSKCERVDF